MTARRSPDGAVALTGQVFGTYVHGLFDSLPFTAALVDRLSRPQGPAPARPRTLAGPPRRPGRAPRRPGRPAPDAPRPRTDPGGPQPCVSAPDPMTFATICAAHLGRLVEEVILDLKQPEVGDRLDGVPPRRGCRAAAPGTDLECADITLYCNQYYEKWMWFCGNPDRPGDADEMGRIWCSR